MNDIIKKYIVIRFNSIQEGVDFMSSYEYSSSFIVVDTIYDKNGSETTYDNVVELKIEDIRNVVTDTNQFIESVICYDGNNLFFEKLV
jgi:hypothetical protein